MAQAGAGSRLPKGSGASSDQRVLLAVLLACFLNGAAWIRHAWLEAAPAAGMLLMSLKASFTERGYSLSCSPQQP